MRKTARLPLAAMRLVCGNLIQIVGPPLHHLPAFREVLRVIVGGPDGIPLSVGKLTLDHVGSKAVLV